MNKFLEILHLKVIKSKKNILNLTDTTFIVMDKSL